MTRGRRRRLVLGRLPGPLRRRRFRSLVGLQSRVFTALERRLVRAGRRSIGGWLAGDVPVLLLTTTGRRSIGGWLAGDVPVLLLTTTGRRTGTPRTTPLLYARRPDGSLLLVAANGAADWDPAWLLNVRSSPHVHVELDGMRTPMTAHELSPADRTAVWPEACAAFPASPPPRRGAAG